MKRTTFTKKSGKGASGVVIPGTHPSLHNGLLLVSTGIPSLDVVLGGGLPVGSIMMVEEDLFGRFSKIILKYYLAEGVMCNHSLFVASFEDKNEEILTQLPKPVTKDILTGSKTDDMKIAFRYRDLSTATNSLDAPPKYGHYYDISRTMDKIDYEHCGITTLNLNKLIREDTVVPVSTMLRSTLNKLNTIASDIQHTAPKSIVAKTKLNIIRAAIPGLGSPLWCENTEDNVSSIARFLHALRALARNSLMTCVVTVPTHLYTPHQVNVIRHMVDCSIELESFSKEKTNPVFSQFHGLIRLKKLPCLNSLVPFIPQSLDLGFELKKTKFQIKCLHLPPDMSDGAAESDGKTQKSPCDSNTLHRKLDF
uniref:putative elongator complex protein 4 n=1 Tax=Ciona intestinalis TaxID=7719 RepID=UPI000180D16B|nr:putative elongator complex protein 4 [Ciona intestinalis]XP_018667235.1 putative elongator complex protein 4 [Ciona intestinalis]XP_026690080.1 putative elongator complex protein 4 [Ciona intestinalis]XP_026690081.1 putative elongator complex protein 4 [Ciona intestinalis]|eukprot:XP_002121089.1 putative elongator complex protein 4 [Ciona intestinalis]